MGIIRRQDISLLFLYYLGYSKVLNILYRILNKSRTVFITFHDVLPENEKEFESKMLFLKRKTNVISMDDYKHKRLDIKKINTVITFDDGYKSWITFVAPLLKKLKLPAVFFISSGFIGLSPEDEIKFMKGNFLKNSSTGCLSHGDVKRLADEGFTIGGHTVNHCKLSEINDKKQIHNEILGDKISLEKVINRKIEYFSYPFGLYSNLNFDIKGILKESGYNGAVTLMPGANETVTDPYLICRMITGARLHNEVFKAIVLDNYSAVDFLKKLIRKLIKLK
jgi:peptidoglycan/xylan/chitin deacetylase (PgdA/CDA1 family)